MSTQNWLTLMEYSAKYKVSLSTLRRRIKASEMEHKLIDGKYMVKDGPSQIASSPPAPETVAPPIPIGSQKQREEKPDEDRQQFWLATQGLLNEIKKAYSLVLQEKEEQILQLKEEVADLKTLVRVLEEDNARVKSLQPKMDFDLGLEL